MYAKVKVADLRNIAVRRDIFDVKEVKETPKKVITMITEVLIKKVLH